MDNSTEITRMNDSSKEDLPGPPMDTGVTEAAGARRINTIASMALAMFFLAQLCSSTVVDLDLYHEMSLFRLALQLGWLPTRDVFSYTPTVPTMVQHEWGTGAILYFVVGTLGGGGLMALRYLLAGAIGWVVYRCARRGGAEVSTLLLLAPVAVMFGMAGFVTVMRAQMFTLLFAAVLLWALEEDRLGRRWWIAPWLALYVLWLNLHAGFVVALGLLALHAGEQFLRGQPVRHLLAVWAAMVALVAVNPYGLDYYAYLWRALTMPRPVITEWVSLLHDPSGMELEFYTMSLVVVVYAVARLGLRGTPGLVMVLVTAALGFRHIRHMSLYGLVWLSYVPGHVQSTPLGEVIQRLWRRHGRVVLAACLGVCVLGVYCFVRDQAWQIRVPVNEASPGPKLIYPAGAVEYLREEGFRGNVMTPFNQGSFVMWELYPAVKISLDSRYEVAYPPEAVEESLVFYGAQPGWQSILTKYPTDVVLVPVTSEVHKAMPQAAGWHLVYQDDQFELYARAGLTLPALDRRGQKLVGRFP
jgi:hypothetical protein